jgi:hypothetical protein
MVPMNHVDAHFGFPVMDQAALGDRVKIHALQRAPEINGVVGEIVVPFDRGTGRWGVRADSDGRVRALRPANLLRLDVHGSGGAQSQPQWISNKPPTTTVMGHPPTERAPTTFQISQY